MDSPPPTEVDPERAAEDKGPGIITAIVIVTVLETLFVAARLYVRGVIKKKLQPDDYIIVVAVLCGWAAVAFGVVAAHAGNGRHFDLLTKQQMSDSILWTTAGFAPGILSFGLPKLAVIYLLVQLLNPGRPHKIFLWVLGIWCNLSLISCIVLLFAQCSPVESQWNFDIPQKCIDPNILVSLCIYAGTFSAFTDIYLAIYPAVVLYRLQLPIRKKIALTAALGIGSVAGIVSIYKTTKLPGLMAEDFSYETSDIVIWTCVEGSTIIMAASIPVLQPLADKLFRGRLFGSSFRTGQYKNYGSGKNGPQASYEMSYPGRKRGKPNDPNGLTFLDQTYVGSEESILGAKDGAKQQVSRSLSPGSRGIVRTDVVTVSHSSANQQTRDDATHQGRAPF